METIKKEVYYLIYLDTFGCVEFEAIIGVASSWREVLELLGNYYILQLKRDDCYTWRIFTRKTTGLLETQEENTFPISNLIIL